MDSKNKELKKTLKSILTYLKDDEDEAIEGYTNAINDINLLDINIDKKSDIIKELNHILEEEREHWDELDAMLSSYVKDSVARLNDIGGQSEEYDEDLMQTIFFAMMLDKQAKAKAAGDDNYENVKLTKDDITDNNIWHAIENSKELLSDIDMSDPGYTFIHNKDLMGQMTKYDKYLNKVVIRPEFDTQNLLDFFTTAFKNNQRIQNQSRNKIRLEYFEKKGFNNSGLSFINGTQNSALNANALANYLVTSGYFKDIDAANMYMLKVDKALKDIYDTLKKDDFEITKSELLKIFEKFLKTYDWTNYTEEFPKEDFIYYVKESDDNNATKNLNTQNTIKGITGNKLTNILSQVLYNNVKANYNITREDIFNFIKNFNKNNGIKDDYNIYDLTNEGKYYTLKRAFNKELENEKYKKDNDELDLAMLLSDDDIFIPTEIKNIIYRLENTKDN